MDITKLATILHYVAFQNRQLQDDTLITRQRALNALCDVLHNPEHVSAALKVGKLRLGSRSYLDLVVYYSL